MELYIYLDFAKGYENPSKQSDLECLSEKYSYHDYEGEHNEKSIVFVFNKICSIYSKEKIGFDLENEKLLCKCVDLDTDKIIFEEEI